MTEGLVYSDAPPHAPVVVNETSTPAGALMRCEDLRKNDKVAESRKKLYGGIGWGAFILGFISVFVGAVGEVFVVFYGTAVFAVVAIGAAIAYGISGRADIDDRKLDVVHRVIETFRPEMHPKRSVQLWIDFGGYDRTSPLSNTTSLFNATGLKAFERPWLKLRFTLLDGSTVSIQAKTSCKRKQKAKRKYTKMKDTLVDDLDIEVKTPADKALDPAATSRAQAALRAARGPHAKGVRIKPRVLVASFRTSPGRRIRGRGGWSASSLQSLMDGPKAVQAVLHTYQAVRAARAS